MKNFFLETETNITHSELKPGWIKKTLGKHIDCACSFIGNYKQDPVTPAQADLPETIEACMNMIIEHRGLNQKELITLLQCLLLTLKNCLGDAFNYKHGSLYFEGKLIGLYQTQSRFRSGLIHLAFLNSIEDNKKKMSSLSEMDLLAKNFGIAVMQSYSDSIEHINTTLNSK